MFEHHATTERAVTARSALKLVPDMCFHIAEILAAVKDVALALAGVTTAVVAVLGLKSWSRELRGKAAFEVARGMARAAYKLRDEITLCRSPLVRAGEFPEGYQSQAPNKSGEVRAGAYGHVFANRWAPVYAALQEFDTQTLEAEALLGQAIRLKTDLLRSVLSKLSAAIEAFIDNEGSEGKSFESDKEFGRKIRSEVFAIPSGSKNPLSAELAAAVLTIENELRPHLRRG